ncbi:hypothetical protein YN1_5710 [Nanoarchaeota archaeon]
MVTAILVTNITYADYITASVVGEVYKIPIYTVRQNPSSINETVQMLLQNNVTNVIVIGGPAVISNLLLQDLNESDIKYTWIWGATRYDTSADVALYFWNSSSSAVLITRDLVNHNVKGYKLKLVTEAVETAESNNIPLLIVPDGVLPTETVYTLEKLNVSNVYIFTGNIGDLGNITDQLNSLGIKYTIYTPNITPSVQCNSYIYVNITDNTSWEDIRYLLIGELHGACIVPYVVNQPVNVTLEKDELEKEIDDDFMKYRNNNINVSYIIEKHINRLIDQQVLLVYKFALICNVTNNSLPICTVLPQLNQSLQQTIQELKSGNVTAIPYLMSLQNNLEMDDWNVVRSVGEGFQENVEEEHFDKIRYKIEVEIGEEEGLNSSIMEIEGEERSSIAKNNSSTQASASVNINTNSNNNQNSNNYPFPWGG